MKIGEGGEVVWVEMWMDKYMVFWMDRFFVMVLYDNEWLLIV